MNYFRVYNHFYQKTHTITKRMVINEMKKAKEKQRPFLTVYNRICEFLYDYYTIKYTADLRVSHKEAFHVFNDRYSYYEGDSDNVVEWVLEDEVLNVFNKDSTSSYTRFVANLAIESSLKEAQRHYRNYEDYYKLIYDLDMYENFFFKDFKGIRYTSSLYYKNMMDMKYPHLKKERKEIEKLEKSNHNNSILKNTNDKEYQINELLNSFSNDEKYLLIHVVYSLRSDPTLKLTDFMKLVKIVGTIEDNSIFYKIPKAVTSYSKVSKGIDYYSSVDSQIKLIESVISKLSSFNIGIVQDELLKIKTKFYQKKN